MDNRKASILVVDDEEDLLAIVKFHLQMDGYDVLTVSSCEEADRVMVDTEFSLILLDVMLPGESGFEYAERLRAREVKTPIVFLTALGSDSDVIRGLNIGADDYIAKPFTPDVLKARVKAVLRRVDTQSNAQHIIRYEGLEINKLLMCVIVDGQPINLTPKEIEVLILLMTNANRVYSRSEILSLVWRDDVFVLERTVDVNIARLRKKIGKYGDLIAARVGYGYYFKA